MAASSPLPWAALGRRRRPVFRVVVWSPYSLTPLVGTAVALLVPPLRGVPSLRRRPSSGPKHTLGRPVVLEPTATTLTTGSRLRAGPTQVGLDTGRVVDSSPNFRSRSAI